jgi:integrase
MSLSPRHTRVQFSAPVLPEIEAQRARFKNAQLARHTVVSYERDWRTFCAWCKAAGRTPLPASSETVELYVTDLVGRGRKVATVERHTRGIQHAHRDAGLESPCGAELHRLLRGARRTLCQMPVQKEAVTVAELRRIVKAIGHRTAIGARNCAILLFGFASALRRSSLAALRREDLRFYREGIVVTVRHEKQDRAGKGRILTIPKGKCPALCPVRALRRWLEVRGGEDGPLFCRVMRGHPNGKPILGNRITQIVQEAVDAIGLDRTRYGAHSLRAGFVTAALERGVNEIAVARHTGHASLDMLRLYMRSRHSWRGNACAKVGL